MRTRANAIELVKAAFDQAKKKHGPDSRTMTLAVLNNRLLQITDRRFKSSDFGAKDLRSLIALLGPEISLVGGPPHFEVELVQTGQDSESETRTGAVAGPVPISSVARPLADEGRVRKDLWLAIVDYASGHPYVWDEALGQARPAKADDSQPRLPTLTPVELAEWRQTFIDAHRGSLIGADLANAMRWQEQGLSTNHLPTSLQQRWNKDLTLRVRQRLHAFFSVAREPGPVGEDASSPEDPRSRGTTLDEELASARDRGDNFSVGELLARSLSSKMTESVETVLARVTSAWASAKGALHSPDSLSEVSAHIEAFSRQNLASAFVNALRRMHAANVAMPDSANDVAFRLRADIAAGYGIEDKRSPVDICRAAVAHLDAAVSELEGAVGRFLRTTPATAKGVSIEVTKLAHRLYPMLVPAERQYLRDLEVLIGPAFRKLCEAYERNDDVEVIRRSPEFMDNVKSHRPAAGDPRTRSSIWLGLVQPILDHIASVVEDATTRGEVALAPSLRLRNPSTKADLRIVDREIFLSFSLMNFGRGHAHDVSLQRADPTSVTSLSLVEPPGPFDVPPGGEQLVRVRVFIGATSDRLEIPLRWLCQTTVGRQAAYADCLVVSQQVTEPNWDALLASPPYSLNPIRRPESLYGRESSLRKLRLAAMAGASTFVWGQKRIGKTSLLQVLAAELGQRSDTTCLLLRMGEVASLHEGELARLVAQRLVEQSGSGIAVPSESEFGAGISRLIPLMELLVAAAPGHKFVVIIDEFDDLDSTFYMGERGKQFVKALRSVSEVGLTFFFVGSERMEAIYGRHQADLNKWTNVQLDRIDSRTDCRALIETPVSGVIEFSTEAIDFIIDYTTGNPFYIHNFCYQVFDRCLQEHRTFVDDNDTDAVRLQLLRALGATNFAHFWEDNPVLDPSEKRKASAENCIALSCISVLGGRYESIEDIQEVQDSLPLSPQDRASGADLRRACERLIRRRVLIQLGKDEGFVVGLQIFREWLGENAVSKLLPVWAEHAAEARERADGTIESNLSIEASDSGAFPIAEDEMLAVAQRLVYCGRQKDVAEIRSWLRQFDDDGRIEIAFLLLKRVAERGFINEGMKARALQKLEEMVNSRRQELGGKIWKIVRGRRDNLCIGYVDSEHKSGASTARELQKIIRPGKCAATTDLDGWMRSHAEDDAIVVIVDDFAGSGETIANGLKRFKAQVHAETWQRYADARRISLYVMFAFPEAIERARRACPGVDVVAATTLGDDLRACDDSSEIFTDDGERRFAREVLVQIGRDLYPSAPLGFGDLGALVVFHNAAPNNTLPIFWSDGQVRERSWKPLFPRA